MNERRISALIDGLADDAGLRQEFRADPVGVCERFGLELSDEQRMKLEAEDWEAVSDDELLSRLGGPGTAAYI